MRLRIALGLALLVSVTVPAQDRDTARRHVQKGNDLYDSGAYDEATVEYKAAMAADPGWSTPHYELAQTLWQQKRFTAADAEAEKALSLEPECWLCVVLRGAIADDAGKPDVALTLFRTAAEMDPKQAKPHFEAGVALIRLQRVEESIAELKKAQELEPKYASPYFLLGNIYFRQGRLFLADDQYREAAKLEPDSERGKKAKERSTHQITLDSSAPQDESVDALSYCLTRAADMLPEEYRKRRPGADTYGADLEDDASVYSSWAQIISEGERAKHSKMYYLVRVRDAGYMKPFLLVAYPDRYPQERIDFEQTSAVKLVEFRQWAEKERIPLAAPRIRCEVRWMERSW